MLDEESAAYPWEALHFDGDEGNEPIALRASMIRQLITPHPMRSDLCTNGEALVIGDPVSDFIELPGAQDEARRVMKQLGERFECGNGMIKPTGRKVLKGLMSGSFQILHLSGHGVFDYAPGGTSDPDLRVTGMAIGDGLFLTPSLINRLPATPEFVFINCCHLGNTAESAANNFPSQPGRLAANLATQLIRQGVRAVIAAGWAVDDLAALTFADRFYHAMLKGETFGNATHYARKETENNHPSYNTWAAYQCYGDPDYRFHKDGDERSVRNWEPVTQEEAIVEICNIGEEAKVAETEAIAELKKRLDNLEARLENNWLQSGRLQEARGNAWGQLMEHELAIQAYEAAIKAKDSGASQRAEEQLANMQARFAVELCKLEKNQEGIRLVRDAEERLEKLSGCRDQAETSERLALKGSCAKRLAHVCSLSKSAKIGRAHV